jgi:hypothetical protein
MRTALGGLLLLTSSTVASAEVWLAREGSCGELRSRWDVQQQADGVWVGSITSRLAGGPCAPRTDEENRFEVRAVLQGDTFFALRRNRQGEFCTYYAEEQQRGMRGIRLCEGNREEAQNFTLRFPQGRAEQPEEQDDWLREPQNFDRRQAPPPFRGR